jgi:hypothetical protein
MAESPGGSLKNIGKLLSSPYWFFSVFPSRTETLLFSTFFPPKVEIGTKKISYSAITIKRYLFILASGNMKVESQFFLGFPLTRGFFSITFFLLLFFL